MDGQNPHDASPPLSPSGNRPPPPPPRSSHGMGAATQQPSAVPAAPQQPAPAPPITPAPPTPPPAPGNFSGPQPTYPQQTAQQPYGHPPPPPAPPGYAQQGQPAYQYSQGGQYYQYPPARSGFPMWAWFTGGGALLAVIAGTIILALVLGGSKGGGGTPGGGGGSGGGSGGGGGGGSGGGNSPREVAVSFWSNMIQHNYDAARSSLAPGSTLTTDQLRQLMETNEQNNQTTYKSVTAGAENITGDTATVPLEMQTANGRTADLTPSVAKVDNKWFVADPGFPNLPGQP